jgi:energy-coupling factor transporter ATP-binding protein EcfA2
MPTFDDWSAQLRLADFDRLVDGVRQWVESSPPWPPFDRARAVWVRIAPRVEQLRIDLDRVLVVGVVGGTGTGKSTLLNALVGQRICPAGDIVRPTTRRPVVLTQPNLDMSFLRLDDCQPEVHRLPDAPLLSQMVLVDCPDPDTQSRHNGDLPSDDSQPTVEADGNLDLLRRILPHCDVLVCTGTAQKYKTHAVLDELLRNAPGRQIVFVQTHKAIDADITADWQRHLQSHGFTVPHTFRIDSEEALDRLQAHRPAPAEFSALVDFLRTELAERGRHRILRTNALDLLSWFLAEAQREADTFVPALAKLEQAVADERNRLLTQVKSKLHEQIGDHRGVWRARLLREVTLRWGGGAFASFLRLFNSARSLLPFLPALRARGLGPMLVTGGIGAGQALARQIRERWSDGSWIDAAELGLNAGDLAQSQSVLEGFAREARIAEENKTVRNSSAETADLLMAAAKQFETQVDAEIGSAIERRVAGKAGVFIHGVLELLFIALPALLLWRLAKNFFYEHLWVEPSRPLLGFDFLLQSALWIVVWGLLLRGLLAWRLQRGLKRDLSALVDRLNPATALGPLFDEFIAPAQAIRQHLDKLATRRGDIDRLQTELEAGASWQLGRLRTESLLTTAANERK